MPSATPIRRVLMEHRSQLVLNYSLFALEMLGMLLRPYFLGVAVNGLVKGEYRGLMQLVVVHLLWLVVGTMRHMYDSRTFSAIYTSFVTRLLSQPAGAAELSKRSALSSLARQVTDFLEFDVNYLAEAFYNIFGSLVILFVYDRRVVAICFAILIPVMIIARRYGRSAVQLNREQFDELEKQVDILATQDTGAIKEHYGRLRAWQIKLSDLEAWNFGATELCVLLSVSGSLLVSASAGGMAMQVGSIIGMYTYLLKFASGLETIPYMVQRLGALRDILRRAGAAEREVAAPLTSGTSVTPPP